MIDPGNITAAALLLIFVIMSTQSSAVLRPAAGPAPASVPEDPGSGSDIFPRGDQIIAAFETKSSEQQ